MSNDLIIRSNNKYEIPFQYDIHLKPKNNKDNSSPQNEDLLSSVFNPNVSEADKYDYLLSASSGMLAAAINTFWVGSLSLDEARSWGEKETNKFVLKVARTQGYKGNDLSAAIKKLEDLYHIPGDSVTAEMGGGKQHHLRDFTHHPTIVGLVFSILSQFTYQGYGTDTDGNFIRPDISNDEFIGKNICEKIFFGTAIWAFHLISDMAGSSQNAGKGTGIPGVILSTLKELSALPLIKELSVKYKGNDVGLSVWIAKLFNGTAFRSDSNPKGIQFDIRTEMGMTYQIGKQAIPVVANECLIRCFYLIRRLCNEIKDKDIHSIKDLAKLDAKRILPYNNRTITHMITVSSGIFFSVTTATAAVRSAVKAKGNKEKFAKDFLLSVNYVGIGRFAFSLYAESKYLVSDAKKFYEEYKKRNIPSNSKDKNNFSFNCLMLSSSQSLIMNLLYMKAVSYDIEHTKNKSNRELKTKWLRTWESQLNRNNLQEPLKMLFTDETIIQLVEKETAISEDLTWFYLIALELQNLEPYYPLVENDEEYKGLKLEASYYDEKLCDMQNIISSKELTGFKKAYRKALADIKNQSVKSIAAIATTLLASAATGGAALYFAPQIAVALAGGSFAGLYGAALTNASLAFIGGGLLAVGGLGVAGGTAIIAGGGSLIGLLGSSAINAASLSSSLSSDYVLCECAKILTICRYVLINRSNNNDGVIGLLSETEKCIDKCKYELEYSTVTDKKTRKEQKKCLLYLERCAKHLRALIDKE